LTKIRVLQEDCDPELGEDKSLPYTCYLITYKDKEGNTKYDLAVGNKQVDIFDYYWDKYRDNFVTMTQSKGAVNPKMWNAPGTEKKEEKKKK
tara:strand:- start:1622 stop:1897 length:276 start_codon:yes stop_codon:yes gene_type:complete